MLFNTENRVIEHTIMCNKQAHIHSALRATLHRSLDASANLVYNLKTDAKDEQNDELTTTKIEQVSSYTLVNC
jgi:hypothetical protein